MRGYKATRDADGVLTIHRVPIFVECKRGDVEFDTAWISTAVAKAKQAEREGYLPPLHIRHHESSTDLNDSVRAAGFFRVLGTAQITFKGARRVAIMADLVVTDPLVQDDVLAKRLPYRSVEIFDVESPAIDSLALLDHEAPYLELPMLMVAEVEEPAKDEHTIRNVDTCVPGSSGLVRVANATFANPWQTESPENADLVVACFRRGRSAHLFFEDPREGEAMTTKKTDEKKVDEKKVDKPTGQNFADDGDKGGDDEKKTDGDGENMEDGGLDVGAVVKAIESGDISVKDMDAILAAIEAQRADAEEPEAEEAPPVAAPAAAPGAEAMSAEMAAMQGQLDAQEARMNERDEAEAQREDVSAALKRLDGRPLGADLETKLTAFRRDHGAEAFKAYVDSVAETFGKLSGDDIDAEAFIGQVKNAPEAALRYQEHGTDAVEKAARFSREWEELKTRNMVRTSQDRYVQINMEREGVKLSKKASA
jgi:hypothetical protein